MRCKHCGNKLLQKSGTSTRVRVQGALEFGEDGVCRAQCYWCRQPVEVPVVLRKGGPVEEETFLLTEKPTRPA